MTREDRQIELSFKNTGSGLLLKPPESTPFEICGKNGEQVTAEVQLVEGKIIVSAEEVGFPDHVRYGWREWFEATLSNKEGLPASPFRTDDFTPVTKGRYYLDTL